MLKLGAISADVERGFIYTFGVRDRLSKERRSWNMSRIRGKNTSPEKRVRSLLHRLGFRFRLHGKGLPGRPDIVLAKYRTVIFVHGCFWHRHRGCRSCTTPTNNRAFWVKKLEGNAARDELHRKNLRRLGWRSVIVWECETETIENFGRMDTSGDSPSVVVLYGIAGEASSGPEEIGNRRAEA